MGCRGRRHHLPQGIQAADVGAVRWGLVGGDEPLLVLAPPERAVVVVPEPRALLPRQPSVVELPEPHAPRQPELRVPPPVPPWPPQPAPAPRLQQRAGDAAALVADGVPAAQDPEAGLGRRPVPASVLRPLRAGEPHPRPPLRATGHDTRVRRIGRLHRGLRPVDQLPDGHDGADVARVQPHQPRRLRLELHGDRGNGCRGEGPKRPGVRVRQGEGDAVGRGEDSRGRRRGARAHAWRRLEMTAIISTSTALALMSDAASHGGHEQKDGFLHGPQVPADHGCCSISW